MSLKDRLLEFITAEGISISLFEKQVGMSNGSVSKMSDNTRKTTLDKISMIYPNLNINWLRTGEGNMLKNVINDNSVRVAGENHSVIVGNHNRSTHNNVNNHINISDLPESGYVKIIRPSGEIETYLSTSVYVDGTNEREKELLKQINDLEKQVIESRAIIKSKDEMISMLRELLSHK
ncbi:hypothetical protein [Coprobacter tertius]|uniref:HTH cro/C1-type domain-containing protein n=1 Tax=Coprobacter tertius TaxID=2944915 RepID=A0ABT1MGF0_9BACT|nr:hypothetical protein [Coprobacter tertius]MCP9611717.1 hypothetical protein [Coprobacter tertius]